MPMVEVVLTDDIGNVKNRISLRGDNRIDWTLHFPQYFLSSVIPFIEIQDKLILTGFSPWSIPSKIIDKFQFSAIIDITTNEVDYVYTYPEELFGSNYNWEGGMATLVYPELSPSYEIIHSFSVSHDLYIAHFDSSIYKTVYAGSNTASSIRSIDWESKTTPREVVLAHLAREDIYTAIRYDPWRKVYYRILLQGISNATHSTAKEKKNIAVIIMDEHFNYMGETVIGNGEKWNWKNLLVTKEGLNIEYLSSDDFDEDYLI
jgi:hypothetical protein